MADLMGRLQR